MSLDFETLVRWLNGLSGMPKVSLVFIFCLAFGMIVKKLTFIHNSAIPLLVPMAGTIALPLLSDWPESSAKTVTQFMFLNAVIGFIVGVTATLFHKFALKPLMKKVGIDKEDDTRLVSKESPASDPKERILNPPKLP